MVYLLLATLILISACDSPEKSTQSNDALLDLTPDTLAVTIGDQLNALHQQIERSPKDYSLLQDRSQLYYALDSVDKAIVDIDKAIELFQNGADLHYLRGFYAFVKDDTVQAKESYQASIGLGTTNPEAFYQLGQLFFFQGKYDLAMKQYEFAAEKGPEDPTYVFAQGLLEETRRRHSKAILKYKASLELDSTFIKSLAQLHDLYLNEYQNEEEALRYNDQLLRNHPTHPLGRFQRGNYHLREALRVTNSKDMELFKSRINEAVTEYTITVNRDPDFAQAWYNRGYCYFLGDSRLNEAIRDFEKTLSLKPDHAPANFMLGSIVENSGDFQTAYNYYQKAAEIEPSNEDYKKAVVETKAKLR